jgi:hypothetical protein
MMHLANEGTEAPDSISSTRFWQIFFYFGCNYLRMREVSSIRETPIKSSFVIDRTTGETTSHLTKAASCQVIGYSHLTKQPQNGCQVVGYPALAGFQYFAS